MKFPCLEFLMRAQGVLTTLKYTSFHICVTFKRVVDVANTNTQHFHTSAVANLLPPFEQNPSSAPPPAHGFTVASM